MSIRKVASKDFEISKLKKKISKELRAHESEAEIVSRRCRSLYCRCITTSSDFDYYNNPSNPLRPGAGAIGSDDSQKQLENDVSNICLKLLSFLLLDGDVNRAKNLEQLFQQSMNFLDRQRGPNEIMVEVFYPIYTTSFQQTYQKLEKGSNYSDPFTYDQRMTGSDGTNLFIYDENENTCENVADCKDTLRDLASTWMNVINIMSFDWKMGIGSMISNLNYLMMVCSDTYSLQTNEEMWAPNKEFGVPCITNEDTKALFELIQTITEEIFNLHFNGVYLNDLVGYLGYSSTFDISSLQKDKYMYNTRNLHPILGMDTAMDEEKLRIEGWRPCNYLGTFQNWIKRTSNPEKIEGMGKCAISHSS